MDDIQPKVPAAPVRLFDPLRRHMCKGGNAWKTRFYTHVYSHDAMDVFSPLDGD